MKRILLFLTAGQKNSATFRIKFIRGISLTAIERESMIMTDFKPFDSANKVLITGAAGFIGFHLAKRLLAMGATILGLDK